MGFSPEIRSSFYLHLRSNLLADYGPDIFGGTLKTLQLAILDEIFGDAELSSETRTKLEQDLWGLVPTATGQAAIVSQPTFPTETVIIPPTTTETAATPLPLATTKPIATMTMTPIVTPTATKTNSVPTATPGISEVIPLLECITENEDHSYTAYWGYQNPNDQTVEIPIGSANYFSPEPKDRGQPTSFLPGRSPEYPSASFSNIFNGDSLFWHLNGKEATASSKSLRCIIQSQPVETPKPNDTQPPQISGGILDPAPGNLNVCTITVTVTDLRVVDPAPSSGIEWVKLKYKVEPVNGGVTDWIFSNPLTLCSGGPTQEGGWDGCYDGSIQIEIDPSWASPAPDRFHIALYSKARDQAGHETCHFLGEYTMPAECGKPQ